MNNNYTIEVKTAKVNVDEYICECVDIEKFLPFCKACRVIKNPLMENIFLDPFQTFYATYQNF